MIILSKVADSRSYNFIKNGSLREFLKDLTKISRKHFLLNASMASSVANFKV